MPYGDRVRQHAPAGRDRRGVVDPHDAEVDRAGEVHSGPCQFESQGSVVVQSPTSYRESPSNPIDRHPNGLGPKEGDGAARHVEATSAPNVVSIRANVAQVGRARHREHPCDSELTRIVESEVSPCERCVAFDDQVVVVLIEENLTRERRRDHQLLDRPWRVPDVHVAGVRVRPTINQSAIRVVGKVARPAVCTSRRAEPEGVDLPVVAVVPVVVAGSVEGEDQAGHGRAAEVDRSPSVRPAEEVGVDRRIAIEGQVRPIPAVDVVHVSQQVDNRPRVVGVEVVLDRGVARRPVQIGPVRHPYVAVNRGPARALGPALGPTSVEVQPLVSAVHVDDGIATGGHVALDVDEIVDYQVRAVGVVHLDVALDGDRAA